MTQIQKPSQLGKARELNQNQSNQPEKVSTPKTGKVAQDDGVRNDSGPRYPGPNTVRKVGG